MPVESIVDGLQHAAEAFHTAAAQITVELTGPEAIEGLQTGGEDTLNSLSNGVSLVKGKTEAFEKAKILRRSHNRHRYILKIVRQMMRNSLLNKARIMLPAFVGSLFVPRVVFSALSPAFAAFGAHLGMEAVEDTHHLIVMGKKRPRHEQHALGDAPNPDKVLDEKMPNRLTLRQVVDKADRADRTTTIEITAAVLGSIDNLPLAEQIPIMGVYGLGMTFGVYGMTTVLVKMEDWGQRLEAWQPQKLAGKILARTSVPARVGVAMQEISPRLFHVMPWLGAAAKFVTSGRVINHASPFLEEMTERAAHAVTELPLIGHNFTGFATTMVLWGATGVTAGLGAKALTVPIKKMLWTNTARALAIHAIVHTKPNFEAPSMRHPMADYRLAASPPDRPELPKEGMNVIMPPSSSFTPVTLERTPTYAPVRKDVPVNRLSLHYAS